MGEVMNNIKCIYFPNPYKEYTGQFDELFNKYPTLMLDPARCKIYGDWTHNELHHIPQSYNEYIIPEICKFLDVNFDINDFKIIPRKSQLTHHDVSYLFPVRDKKFTIIHYNKVRKNCTYKDLVGFSNFEKNKTIFLNNTVFNDIECDYHLISAFAHQCCRIINNDSNNGRKIILSCDSQSIPIIGPLAYYFKEVICLDKRSGDWLGTYDIKESEYEMAYLLSKYEFEKYAVTNMKKIRSIG